MVMTQTELGITLTPVAVGKVQEIMEQEGNAELGLRVYVAGGGCSGLQYGMALDDNAVEDDYVVTMSGIRVLVDSESARFLEGSEIDYVDSLMGAGFTVNNPNAVSTCGCGHSFRTSDEGGSARGCGSGGCGH